MDMQHTIPGGVPTASIFQDILGRQGWGDRPAILGQEAATYGQLLAAAEDLAARLRAMGIERGQLVGLCLPTSRAYVVALLGVYLAGGVSVLLNPNTTAAENQHVRRDAGLAFLITRENEDALAADAVRPAVCDWPEGRIFGPLATAGDAPRAESGLIIYTSGSTSRPKGVLLGEAALSANVRAVADYLALAPAERTIISSPPTYSFCLSQVLTHLWAGASLCPWPLGLLYPVKILQAVKELRLTGLATNPTSLRLLLRVQGPAESELAGVRYVMVTGQALDSTLAQCINQRFRGARLVSAYGCTENAPRIAYHWLPAVVPPRKTPWPVGKAVAGTEIRVVDDQDRPLPPGQVGEVLVCGSSLMSGYWRRPELTAEKMAGGWWHSSDLGFSDGQGDLNLVGRADNVFSVGHEKVVPEEVEEVIRGVPGVVEAGVAPIPDALLDKAAVAVLVLDGSEKEIVDRVRVECLRRLPTAKRPQRILVTADLPRTAAGKLDRRGLCAWVSERCPTDPGQSQRERR
jgi:long-chain acyl-CoA synthetase